LERSEAAGSAMTTFLSRTGARRAVELALYLILGGVFIYAGWTKIGAPLRFADSIATFHLIPERLIIPFALALPVFEIIAGLMVVTGIWRSVGCMSLILLCVIFLVAIGAALARGIPVSCGCFGGDEIAARPWFEALRDAVLLVLAVWLYRRSRSSSMLGEP
jgi:uncharacterized membrane protein YphA (DoxX/SURF4 family)